MAPANEDASKASDLAEFQIIPRETIRAAVFFSTNALHAAKLEEVLKDIKYESRWPLEVQVGSALWDRIEEPLTEAKSSAVSSKYSRLVSPYSRLVVRPYLVDFPNFYDTANEVNQEGLFVGSKTIILAPPKGVYRKASNRKAGKKLKTRAHLYLSDRTVFGEEKCREGFGAVLEAAKLKAAYFPPATERTEQWRMMWEAALENPPTMPGISAFIPENYEGWMLAEDLDKKSEVSITGTEYSTSVFTPAETRSSSPTPTVRPTHDSDEHVDHRNTSKELEVVYNYTATLRIADESVTIDLEPYGANGEEHKVVTASKEMWEWMVEKGYNASLGDVVELAKKMGSKNHEGSC